MKYKRKCYSVHFAKKKNELNKAKKEQKEDICLRDICLVSPLSPPCSSALHASLPLGMSVFLERKQYYFPDHPIQSPSPPAIPLHHVHTPLPCCIHLAHVVAHRPNNTRPPRPPTNTTHRRATLPLCQRTVRCDTNSTTCLVARHRTAGCATTLMPMDAPPLDLGGANEGAAAVHDELCEGSDLP